MPLPVGFAEGAVDFGGNRLKMQDPIHYTAKDGKEQNKKYPRELNRVLALSCELVQGG